MTIRTFWTIFLKILGIWLVLEGLAVIPQFIGAFAFFNNDSENNITAIIVIIALLIFTLGLYIMILRFFIFKTEWIIDKLKLDKGFLEERLDLNVQLKTVLTISTIVVGGLIFVEGLPILCKQIFVYLQQKSRFIEFHDSSFIVFYFIKTLIGYLIMTNSKFVIDFINKEKRKIEE